MIERRDVTAGLIESDIPVCIVDSEIDLKKNPSIGGVYRSVSVTSVEGITNLSVFTPTALNLPPHFRPLLLQELTHVSFSVYRCALTGHLVRHGFFFFWSNNSHEDSSSWPLEDFMSLKQTLIDEFENH